MRTLFLLLVLLSGVSAAEQTPTCAAVTKKLFGISLGRAQDFPSGLRLGLRHEGTAELIADVYWESLEGSIDGIAYPRIMAFLDRGQFTGIVAIGRITSEENQGFERIVAVVAAAANSAANLKDGRASFECEGTMALSIETAQWDDGPAIRMRIMDEARHKMTIAFIAEYCADPRRRRPQDACKK